jgi:hypothetical protein
MQARRDASLSAAGLRAWDGRLITEPGHVLVIEVMRRTGKISEANLAELCERLRRRYGSAARAADAIRHGDIELSEVECVMRPDYSSRSMPSGVTCWSLHRGQH